MVTASPPAPQPGRPATFGVRLHRFWRRVTDGLEVSQLWSQFESEARTSYRLYSKDVEAKTPEGLTHGGRNLHVVKEFFWAVFEKLSPARRVLLLLALILLVLPSGSFNYQDAHHEVHAGEFDLHFWAGLLLLLLLMLEIADRVVMKRDLQIAREIQTWLLPGVPPQIPGLAIAYATRPANTVAGDYYDVFPAPRPQQRRQPRGARGGRRRRQEHPSRHAHGHVSGQPQNAFYRAGRAARAGIANMNRYACGNSQGGLRFTTAFLAEYDPVQPHRRLHQRRPQQSHPAPRQRTNRAPRRRRPSLRHPARREIRIRHRHAGAGRLADDFHRWISGSRELSSGRIRRARLLAAIEAGKSTAPAEMLKRLMAELDLFVGNTPQHDDVTCMLLKAESF
jgi:phosphoserine phosphatase RsbU/P